MKIVKKKLKILLNLLITLLVLANFNGVLANNYIDKYSLFAFNSMNPITNLFEVSDELNIPNYSISTIAELPELTEPQHIKLYDRSNNRELHTFTPMYNSDNDNFYKLEDSDYVFSLNKNDYETFITSFNTTFNDRYKVIGIDGDWGYPGREIEVYFEFFDIGTINIDGEMFYALTLKMIPNDYSGFNMLGKGDANIRIQVLSGPIELSPDSPPIAKYENIVTWGLSENSVSGRIVESSKEYSLVNGFPNTIVDNEFKKQSEYVPGDYGSELLKKYNQISVKNNNNEWNSYAIYSITYSPEKSQEFSDLSTVFISAYKIKTLEAFYAPDQTEEIEFYILVKEDWEVGDDPTINYWSIDTWSIRTSNEGSNFEQKEGSENSYGIVIPYNEIFENGKEEIISYLLSQYKQVGIFSYGLEDGENKYSSNTWTYFDIKGFRQLDISEFENLTLDVNSDLVFEIQTQESFQWKNNGGYGERANQKIKLYLVVDKDSNVNPLPSGDELKEFIVEANEPDNVTMNLFDYWNNDTTPSNETGNPWKIIGNNLTEDSNGGINYHHFLKFLYESRTSKADAPVDNVRAYGIWNHSTEGEHENVTGLVQNTLVNGYPKLALDQSNTGTVWDDFASNTGSDLYDYDYLGNSSNGARTESLEYLFNPQKGHNGKISYSDVKDLLQINQDGYYYYDSKLNFAEFDKETNNFTLYNTWGVYPSGQSPHGQFFPFNKVNDVYSGIAINDDNTKSLIQSNVISRSEIFNHHLGFTMEVDFQQPTSGVINHGSDNPDDMTFKFGGDDDIWVFIDDVLVLDMGGLHSGVYGEINFATGDVQTGLMNHNNERGVEMSGAPWIKTNLKELFTEANKSDSTAWGTNKYKTNTFADGTVHTLKLFYMERGHWDSNFAMYFNLQNPIEHEVYKVDEDGEPLSDATFELYNASYKGNTSYIDEDDTNWYKAEDFISVGESILSVTTQNGDSLGYGQLIGENKEEIDFATAASGLGRDRQNIYILKEKTPPEGHKSINENIILRYDASTNTFKVLNRYEVGAYSSFSAIIEDNTDQLYYATTNFNNLNDSSNDFELVRSSDPDSPKGQNYYEKISDDHQKNALLFAVPMVYTDIGNGYGWYPVYGSNSKGYNVVNIFSPSEYNEGESSQEAKRWALRNNLLAAALRQSSEPEAPDWYFKCETVANTSGKDVSTVRFTAELRNLPGDSSRYLVNNSTISGSIDGTDLRLIGLLVDAESLSSFIKSIDSGTQLSTDALKELDDEEKFQALQKSLLSVDFKNRWDKQYNSPEPDWTTLKDILQKAYINNQEGTSREQGVNLAYIDSFTRYYSSVIYIPNERRELRVLKEDANGNGLPGAVFGLFNSAEEANNGTPSIAIGSTDQNGLLRFVKADLVNNLDDPDNEVIDPAIEVNNSGIADTNWDSITSNGRKEFWVKEINPPAGYSLNDSLIQVIVEDNGIYANASAYKWNIETNKVELIDNPTEADINELQNGGNYNSDRVYVLASVGKLYKSMEKFADKILNPTLLDITTNDQLYINGQYDNINLSEVNWLKVENSLKYQHFWGDDLNFNSSDYSTNHKSSLESRNNTFDKTENGFIKVNAEQTSEDVFRDQHKNEPAILNSRRDNLAGYDLNGIFTSVNVIVVQDIGTEEKYELSPGNNESVQIGDEIEYVIEWNYEGIDIGNADSITITDPLDIGVDFIEASFGDDKLNTDTVSYPKLNGENLSIEYTADTHTVTWIIEDVPNNLTGKVYLKVKVNDNAEYEWHYSEDSLESTEDLSNFDNRVENKAGIKVGKHDAITKLVTNPVNNEGTGNIIIKKEAFGSYTEDDKFDFIITLYNEYNSNKPDENIATSIKGYFGDVYFNNGKGEFYLTSGQEKNITNLPEGYYYVIEEIQDDDKPFKVTVTNNEGPVIENKTIKVDFKNEVYGDLSLTKILDGELPDGEIVNTKYPDEKFSFGITLEADPAINGQYGDFYFTDNVATISITKDQTVYAKGLPAGITYSIEEEDNFNNTGIGTTRSVGDKGTIPANGTATCTFLNKVEETITGSLTIQKEVISNEEVDTPFRFSLELKDSDGKLLTNLYTQDELNNLKLTLDQVTGKYSFSLVSGQSIELKNLPIGTIYTIKEDLSDEYKVSYFTFKEGTITAKEGTITFKEGTITATNSDISVLVINQKIDEIIEPELGSLKILKTVKSEKTEDHSKLFDFDLKLLNLTEASDFDYEIYKSNSIGSEEGKLSFDENGNIIKEDSELNKIQLADKDYIIIKNLPLGTVYQVSESSNEFISSVEDNNELGVINSNEVIEVEFINTPIEKEVGSLTIEKIVQSGRNTDEFNFELTLINHNESLDDVSFDSENINKNNDGKYTFKLSHNESIEINNIPLGTYYEVNELPNENYESSINTDSLFSPNHGFIISDKETYTVQFINTLIPEEEPKGIPHLVIRKTHQLNIGENQDSDISSNENIFTVHKVDKNIRDLVTYSIYVKNVGTDTAHNLVISDTLPKFIELGSIENISVSKVNDQEFNLEKDFRSEVDETGINYLTWKLAELPRDEEVKIDFTVNIGDPGSENYRWTNHAYLSYDEINQEPDQIISTFDLSNENKDIILKTAENINPNEIEEKLSNVYWDSKDHLDNLPENELMPISGETVYPDRAHSNYINGHIIKYSNDVAEEIRPIATEDTGDLVITKRVAGNEIDLTPIFTFTVTLTDTSINGPYGGMTFENGVATVTLRHGQQVIAERLPKDIGYSVVETHVDGYKEISFNEEGVIKANEAVTVDFINEKITSVETGGLTISKIVVDNETIKNPDWENDLNGIDVPDFVEKIGQDQDTEQDFEQNGQTDLNAAPSLAERKYEFIVYLYSKVDLGDNPTYPLDINEKTVEKISFDKLEKKTTTSEYYVYKAEELLLGHRDIAYITELPINTYYKVVEVDDTDYLTLNTGQVGPIPTGYSAHAAFVNYEVGAQALNGNLILEKVVDTIPVDKETEFEFTITLTGITSEKDSLEYNGVIFKKEGDSYVGTVKLKHLQTQVFTEIPVGTRYEIEETNRNGLISSWPENKTEGQITPAVEFLRCTNTSSIASYNLPVKKTVKGNPDVDSVFAFQIKNITEGELSDSVIMPSSNIVYLNGEGTVDFDSIQFTKEGQYRFRVSEINLGNPNYKYDNTVYTVTIDVTNVEGQLEISDIEFTTNDGLTQQYIEFINEYNEDPDIEVVETPNLGIKKDQSINEDNRTTETTKVQKDNTVTYYITATNNGTAVAENVVITDNIPKGLTLVDDSISDNGTVKNGTITWNIGDLAPGTSKTVNFTVTVPEVTETTVWQNIAAGSSDNADDTTSNEVTIYESAENSVANLLIEKDQKINTGNRTKTDQEVVAGDTVTYYVTVRNISDAVAKDVIISDSIPEGLTLVPGSISDNGIETNGRISWFIGDLEAGTSKTVSFSVIVPDIEDTATWTNIASVVYSNNPDGAGKEIPSNEVEIKSKEQDSQETPNVSIQKEQSGTDGIYSGEYLHYSDIGDLITYRITVKNSSKVEASNVVITDDIPLGTNLVEGSISDGGVIQDKTITWNIGTLPAGESRSVTFTVSVIDNNYKIRNTAHLTYTEDAPKNSNEVTAGTDVTDSSKTPSDTVDDNNNPTTGNNSTTSNKTTVGTNTTTYISNTKTGSPKTGLVSGIGLFIALAGISGAGIVVNNKKRRK